MKNIGGAPVDNNPIYCTYCSVLFSNTESFEEHRIQCENDRETKESNSTIIACGICGNNYNSNTFIQHHMKDHFGQPYKLNCTECIAVFQVFQQFDAHQLIHTQTEEYKYIECVVCNRVFNQLKSLSRHFEKFHPGVEYITPFKCIFCDLVFDSKAEVKKHTKSHKSKNTSYKCKKGQTVFSSKKESNSHSESKCDDDKTENVKLERHSSVVYEISEMGPYECNQCDETFSSSHKLECHQKEMHINPSDSDVYEKILNGIDAALNDVVQCIECKREFATTEEYENHAKVHIRN